MSLFKEFFTFLRISLKSRVVGDHTVAVEIPATACTVAGVSTVAGVPAFPGLHSAVDACNISIVSVAAIPTVANVL